KAWWNHLRRFFETVNSQSGTYYEVYELRQYLTPSYFVPDMKLNVSISTSRHTIVVNSEAL
ncbi:hypothetical protein Anas_09805, partial [Armadillidium nasatum]